MNHDLYYQNAGVFSMLEINMPAFRADSDNDIGQILTTCQNHGGKGFGREKEQLLSTILACADNQTLRNFLNETPERADYFSKSKELKLPKISLNDSDIQDKIADRIYQIRCRIVHAKSELGDTVNEPILPFSEAAYLLHHDIALVQLIATPVLVKGSNPLNF
jgi:hypothetical protein